MDVRLLTVKTPAHDKGLIVADGLCPRIRGLIPGALQDLVALNQGVDPLQRLTKEVFTLRLSGDAVYILPIVAHGSPGVFQPFGTLTL